jgi:TetR/AcrR family transcriptional repressor of nem operon
MLAEAKVPKGSFYYYFESKDDLGVAIVRHYAQEMQRSYERTLLDSGLSGRDGIKKFFEESLLKQRAFELRYGYALSNLSSEVAASIEKIALACRETITDLEKCFFVAIERGQRDGTIVTNQNPQLLASILCSVMQGSLLLLKIHRSEQPFLNALDWISRSIFVG